MNARARQAGLTTVEFAITGTLLLVVLFGVIEFGRLMWAWGTLNEATRRGARAAVVCPLDHPAPANIAAFDAPGGGGSDTVLPGLTPAEVDVEYLDGDGNATATFEDVRYVRVSVPDYQFQLSIPLLGRTLTAPAFATTLPRESLGVIPDPGAVDECFGIPG